MQSLKACKPKLDEPSPDELAAMDGDNGNDSEEEEQPVDCCMMRILSLQSDFAHEQSLLYKVGFTVSFIH